MQQILHNNQHRHSTNIRGSDSDPHPQPQNSLQRISVCNQVSNGNSYEGEPGRGKNCSHCSFQDFDSLTKGNQVSLVRIFFCHPESEGKLSDVGVGGRIGILNISLLLAVNQRMSCQPTFGSGCLRRINKHAMSWQQRAALKRFEHYSEADEVLSKQRSVKHEPHKSHELILKSLSKHLADEVEAWEASKRRNRLEEFGTRGFVGKSADQKIDVS